MTVFHITLKGKFSPLLSIVTVADGTPIASQGILTATFSIDGMEKTTALNISDGLQYEGWLGIDFLRLFNIQIIYENDIWCTEKGIIHPFYHYGADPSCILALASIGGLTPATTLEFRKVTRLFDNLIPKPPATLGTCPLAQHRIDVQGHEPVKQIIRR